MKIGILGFTDETAKAYYSGEWRKEPGEKSFSSAVLAHLIEQGRIVIDQNISAAKLRTLLLNDTANQAALVRVELEKTLREFAEQGVTHLALGSLMMERHLDLLVGLSGLPVFTVSAALSRSLISRRLIKVGVATKGTAIYPHAFHTNLLKQGITVCLPDAWGNFHYDNQLVTERDSESLPSANEIIELLQDLESLARQQVSALIYGTDTYVEMPPENLTQNLPDSLKYVTTFNPYTEHIQYLYALVTRCKP